MEQCDIFIIGGGIAGLSCAYFLVKAGKKVCLIDKSSVGLGATWAAAGMLCPIHELDFHEVDVLRAGISSLLIYDEWEKELGDIGLIRNGTLEVALTVDDIPYLQRVFEFQQKHNISVTWLSGDHLLDIEPALSPKIPAGILATNDIQVDNRLLPSKIKTFLERKGGVVWENTTIISLAKTDEGFYLRLSNDIEISAKQIINATGYVSETNNFSLQEKIFPVKGQMLSLFPPDEWILNHTIRIRSKSYGNGYIVPKKDRWLIGSTAEEMGKDQKCTAGGLMDILNRAYLTVPSIYDLPVQEIWSGLRPSTLNRKPILDIDPNSGIFYLNGLYRHGILLAPILGKAMTEFCLHGKRLPETEHFKFQNKGG